MYQGHYEFWVMPFELIHASSAIFQAIMNHTFKDFLLKFLQIICHDIWIYSLNEQKHFKQLDEALKMLRTHKLSPKKSKCSFLMLSRRESIT